MTTKVSLHRQTLAYPHIGPSPWIATETEIEIGGQQPLILDTRVCIHITQCTALKCLYTSFDAKNCLGLTTATPPASKATPTVLASVQTIARVALLESSSATASHETPRETTLSTRMFLAVGTVLPLLKQIPGDDAHAVPEATTVIEANTETEAGSGRGHLHGGISHHREILTDTGHLLLVEHDLHHPERELLPETRDTPLDETGRHFRRSAAAMCHQ